MKTSFSDVQRNVSEIANRQEYTIDVLYELMAAYGRSASSITKLRNGILNLAGDKENTVLQRGVVYFKIVTDSKSLPAEIEKLEQDPLTQRYNPRFLIATDGDYNPQKVEHFIHRVFADAALDLRITDKSGREYKPLEWYSVPIHIVREVVDLIDSGVIVHYVYDSEMQKMLQIT